ncbi:MAG: sel1 repeat family protein [Legionella sp.]|nr:sel1 repeat family protein [Legionella sp.]
MPSPNPMQISLESLDRLIEQLKQGKPICQYHLSHLIYSGLLSPQQTTVKSTISALLRWCKSNIHLSQAFFILGLIHRCGFAVPINYQQAIVCYEKAIALGNTDAMVEKGTMYYAGLGIASDLKAAIAFYERAIELGNPAAMCKLGRIYERGIEGPADFDKAAKLYEQASQQVYLPALTARAMLFNTGHGSPVDKAYAIALLKQGISNGDPSAMYSLGSIYCSVHQYNKAITLFEKAMPEGTPDALNGRAVLYQKGKGSAVDFEKAIALFELAIQKGHIDAMINRALMYQKGEGSAVNLNLAARLFRRAVKKDTNKLTFLSYPECPISYRYHTFMHQKRTEEAVKLVLEHTELIDEFINYDCPVSIKEDLHNLITIKDFINQFAQKSTDKCQLDSFLFSVLKTLASIENYHAGFTLTILDLKKHCLSQLSMGTLDRETVIPTMELAINTWYAYSAIERVDSTKTQLIAALLKQGIGRLIACGKEMDCQNLFPNIAFILGKSIYGEGYQLGQENTKIAMHNILSLIAASYAPISHSMLSMQNGPAFFKPSTIQETIYPKNSHGTEGLNALP